MRRLVVAAFVFAMLAPAAVVGAAPADTISINVKGIQRGAIIEGTVPFEVAASSAAGIKKLEVSISDATIGLVEPNNWKQNVDLAYEWTTTQIATSTAIAPNGEYGVKARAVANGGASKEALVRVIVDNPAAIPTGLESVSTGKSIALEWDANPEPDILGYEVQRGDGTTFATIAQTTDTFYEDVPEPGTYSYRVIAVRNSAARSTGRPSLPTDPVQATIAAAAQRGGKGATSGGALGASRARGFKVKDSTFAPRGLPGGAALPGGIGQLGLPELPDAPMEWGAFDKKLPYELPDGGVPLAASDRAEDPVWKVIPADGMRWLGAGALLLIIAAGLRVAATRIEVADQAPAEVKI